MKIKIVLGVTLAVIVASTLYVFKYKGDSFTKGGQRMPASVIETVNVEEEIVRQLTKFKEISLEEEDKIKEHGIMPKCQRGHELQAGLCYIPCDSGYKGIGLLCWKSCREGYIDDGAFCRKAGSIISKKSYGRGVGKIPGCNESEEKQAGLCYKKCNSGYKGVGPVCWQTCPSGYTDHPASCFKHIFSWYFKKSYGRGVGRIGSGCNSSQEKQAGLCYNKCKSGYKGVGPVCWNSCPSGYNDDGAICRKNVEIYAKETYQRGMEAPIYEGIKKPENIKYITDEQGRSLILHGINASNGAKYGTGLPKLTEQDVIKETKDFGLNVVRLLVFWAKIEPEKGVYDENYLNEVAKRVKWYTDNGAYVLFDMHQDVYGSGVNGYGFPRWATETGIFSPMDPSGGFPWWMMYLDPAVGEAFKNFWEYDKYKYLQDHFIAAFQKLVQRFKDHPRIIGYDLLNEPHGADILPTFEINWLGPFYARLIPALREVDSKSWLFFEPRSFTVNFGWPSYLKKVNDPREGSPRLVYAPHEYPMSLHEGKGYQTFDRRNVIDWSRNRANELDLQKAPLFVGEFGGDDRTPGFDVYLEEITNLFDYMGASWALWSNDKGPWGLVDGQDNENPKVHYLVRTYPRAIAGHPVSFSFDVNTGKFQLIFEKKEGVTGSTEIFVPKRHYPKGFNVEVYGSGDGKWSKTYDEDSQILYLTTDPNGSKHYILITRKE